MRKNKVLKRLGKSLKKHKAKILTGLGIGAMGAATVLAVPATKKSVRQIDEKEKEIGRDLTKKEKVSLCWKNYIYTAGAFGTGATCVIASDVSQAKAITGLLSTVSAAEGVIVEYKDQIAQIAPEKAAEIEEKVKDELIKKDKTLKDSEPAKIEQFSEIDDYLWIDFMTNTKFLSTKNKIEAIRNKLNARLINEEFVSLNEFYYEIGVEPVGIGNDIGWNSIGGDIIFEYDARMKDGIPYGVISYDVRPRHKFHLNG